MGKRKLHFNNLCEHKCHIHVIVKNVFLSPSADLDPVVVVPKESELMFKGEDLTASCNALSSLKTSTVWYKVRLYH